MIGGVCPIISSELYLLEGEDAFLSELDCGVLAISHFDSHED